MSIKYKVQFDIINLNKAEMRDLKIDLISSGSVLEFESDSSPRIPALNESMTIAGREFILSKIDNSWIMEGEDVVNYIKVSIIDKEKQSRDEAAKSLSEANKKKKAEQDMMRKFFEDISAKEKKKEWVRRNPNVIYPNNKPYSDNEYINARIKGQDMWGTL